MVYQSAEVRTESTTSEEAAIMKGVWRGCVLSLLIFNLYAEAIFEEALTEEDEGIKFNGVGVNNIRYADDSLIISSNPNELERMKNKVVDCSEASGLSKRTKTKVIVFSMIPTKCSIKANEEELEQAPSIKYPGILLDESHTSRKEVQLRRIEQAILVLMKMKNLFQRRKLSLELLKCYVFPVLLYSC